jgi:hypothetical protein
MCIEDWRLARLVRSVQQAQTIAANGTFTLAANMQRVGLTVGSVGTAISSLAQITIAVNGIGFWSLKQNETYFHATIVTHGDLVTKSWAFTPIAFSPVLGITEYLMPEGYLQAGLEEFERMMLSWQQSSSQPNR